MAKAARGHGDEGLQERRLTVARVRELADHAQATFHESARFYRLPRANPAYADALRMLRAAAASGRPVRVRFAAPNSDLIETVRSED
jgi:hypothetical protein